MAAPLPTAYIETTIPSYLTARPSQNLIVAGRQQLTHEWWQAAPHRYRLVISDIVRAEVSLGDPAMSRLRSNCLAGLMTLPPSVEAKSLAETYQRELQFPVNVQADLLHLAYAVIYSVSYLVTWNCAHLANPHIIRRVERINQPLAKETPLIVTPEDLLEWEKENLHGD